VKSALLPANTLHWGVALAETEAASKAEAKIERTIMFISLNMS